MLNLTKIEYGTIELTLTAPAAQLLAEACRMAYEHQSDAGPGDEALDTHQAECFGYQAMGMALDLAGLIAYIQMRQSLPRAWSTEQFREKRFTEPMPGDYDRPA